MSAELIPIAVPGTDRDIVATLIEGKPMVSHRHACNAIGVDPKSQRDKLNGKSWACGVLITSQLPGETQAREYYMIDRRTFTMWLATIDTNRVSAEARPIIEAFQAEAADALDAYFNGTSPALDLPAPAAGAIAEANPRVGGDRLACVVEAVHAKATVLRAFRDLVDADHLEAEARRALAGALGEIADIDPGDAPLRLRDYLQQRGMTSAVAEALEPEFDAFLGNRGIESLPALRKSGAPRGTGLRSFTYTEADRPALDAIWEQLFGPHAAVYVTRPSKGSR